jgi:hypothetical protein
VKPALRPDYQLLAPSTPVVGTKASCYPLGDGGTVNPKEIGPISATRMSRRGFIAGAVGGIALVALPAWPDSAQA